MTDQFHDPAKKVNADNGLPENTAKKKHGVVVGVDGSKRSLAAAIWALREAKRINAPLTMVSAYTLPIFPSVAVDAATGGHEDSALAQSCRQILEATKAELGDTEGVEVRCNVALGAPGAGNPSPRLTPPARGACRRLPWLRANPWAVSRFGFARTTRPGQMPGRARSTWCRSLPGSLRCASGGGIGWFRTGTRCHVASCRRSNSPQLNLPVARHHRDGTGLLGGRVVAINRR